MGAVQEIMNAGRTQIMINKKAAELKRNLERQLDNLQSRINNLERMHNILARSFRRNIHKLQANIGSLRLRRTSTGAAARAKRMRTIRAAAIAKFKKHRRRFKRRFKKRRNYY